MRNAAPIRMWAAIAKGPRSDLIIHRSLRLTRADARTAYLSDFDDKYHAEILSRVRFTRVVVSLEDAALKERAP